MFKSLFVLAAVAAAGVTGAVIPQGRGSDRLISLRDGHKEWMTESQVLGLLRDGVNFVDATDGDWDRLQEHKLSAGRYSIAASAFPNASYQKPLVTSLIQKIDKTYIKTFLDNFSAFNNRYYTSSTGVQSAQYLYDELLKIKATSQRTDVVLNVSKFNHTWAQFSVIASLSSTKATGLIDRIIHGAHQDSINQRSPSTGRAPGYDDDGTGVANALSALKLLLANPNFVPGRPIEFHFYSAEEVGLRGSQNVVSKYVADKVPVYAMLNSDMTGYPGSSPAYVIVTDYASAELNSVLRRLAKEYSSLPVIDSACGYACSDHASWNKAGFPVAHHHEGTVNSDNPNIHGTKDTFTYIALDHAVEFLKGTLAFLVELSLYGKN